MLSLVPACYLAHERESPCVTARRSLGLPRCAFVELLQTPDIDRETWVFWAGFYAQPFDDLRRAPPDGHVLVRQDGPCFVIGPGVPAPTGEDAGELTLTTESRRPAVIRFHDATRPTAPPYDGAGGPEPPLAPREIVRFSSAGSATVPPFSACTLAPERLRPSAPATLARGRPLTISWEPTAVDQVEAAFSLPGGAVVACPVAASLGGVTIPGSITAMLPPGELDVGLLARNRASVAAGDHEVVVEVTVVAQVHTQMD